LSLQGLHLRNRGPKVLLEQMFENVHEI
jgi:hypothetical protein